jgi:hypothetical protein
VGLAVDLAFAMSHGVVRAAAGALLVTAFGYGAFWLQSQFRPWVLGDAHTESAPPAAYWTAAVVLAGVFALWAGAEPLTRRWAARRSVAESA